LTITTGFASRNSHGNGDCDQNPDRYRDRDSNRHRNSNTAPNSNSHSIGNIYSHRYGNTNAHGDSAAIAQVKAQVQKVSAQLELSEPSPQTVLNNR
jgi:hypothetical protein